jgi:DDE family transposase
MRRVTDTHGSVQEIEVTGFGWKVIVLIDARTKIPLALKVVQIQVHETLFLRALVTQARTNLAGAARRSKVVFDRGFLAGTDLWWLDQHGITFVVPAKAHMTVTADARAQATAGAEMTGGRRVTPCGMGRGARPAPNDWRPRWWESRGRPPMSSRARRSMSAGPIGGTSSPIRSMPWWCVSGMAKTMGPGAKPSF